MRTISEFPNYKITEDGKVFSLNSNSFVFLDKSNSGYFRVTLSRDGKKKKFFVHRLVAGAYIQNPEKKSDVNHKNGDKEDNTVKNIEWVTPKENMRHARVTLGRRPITQKLTSEDVECIKFFALKKRRNGSQKILAKIFGVTRETISRITLEKGCYA